MVVTHSILVVTPTLSFGESIQQALEVTGTYRVLLVDSALEALTCARNIPFSLAILDHDLEAGNSPDLANKLKLNRPELSLLHLVSDDYPPYLIVNQQPLDGVLHKPYTVSDILKAVVEILANRAEPSVQRIPAMDAQDDIMSDPEPVWLKDNNRTTEYLTRHLLGTTAQAVLIICNARVWAYAGQFEQPVAQELISSLTHLSTAFEADRQMTSAQMPVVLKTIRLETADKETLLYMKSMNHEALLAMAFETGTPLSVVRLQVNHLVDGLTRLSESQPVKTASSSSAWHALTRSYDLYSSPDNTEEDEEIDDDPDELEALPLAVTLPEVFENIPPPVPNPSPQASVAFSSAASGESRPPLSLNQAVPAGELRPVTPAVHSLYYVCLMIPRLPHHLLVGEVSRQLNGAVSQLCLVYGWRLEYIAVRPDYLLWIVNFSPLTSPNYLMRILRQKTSARIFEVFPDLKKDNPSGDFWAPGYLIMSGSHPPNAQIIRDFIHNTREHQGIHSPVRPEV